MELNTGSQKIVGPKTGGNKVISRSKSVILVLMIKYMQVLCELIMTRFNCFFLSSYILIP